jgi:hypothetical protein
MARFSGLGFLSIGLLLMAHGLAKADCDCQCIFQFTDGDAAGEPQVANAAACTAACTALGQAANWPVIPAPTTECVRGAPPAQSK